MRLDLQTRAPSDRPPARRDALHGRRLRKHLRAVAAAAHPAPLDGSADRRHVSHALPDCGVGLPACIRPRRRSLAAPHTTQVGPIIAVTLLSLIGLAGSVSTLAAILVLGGFGCAMFHPPGAALTRLAATGPASRCRSTSRAGRSDLRWARCFFAPFVERHGLHWTPLVAAPGLLLAIITASRIPPSIPPSTGRAADSTLRPYFKPLACLYSIVVLRTLTSLAFATFMPGHADAPRQA